MTCTHRMLNDPAGLQCTREEHEDRGHTYDSSWAEDAPKWEEL